MADKESKNMKKRSHPPKVVNPAERMILAKEKLIARLQAEIKDVREDAEEQVKKIEFRIRQANTIMTALKKGTLVA